MTYDFGATASAVPDSWFGNLDVHAQTEESPRTPLYLSLRSVRRRSEQGKVRLGRARPEASSAERPDLGPEARRRCDAARDFPVLTPAGFAPRPTQRASATPNHALWRFGTCFIKTAQNSSQQHLRLHPLRCIQPLPPSRLLRVPGCPWSGGLGSQPKDPPSRRSGFSTSFRRGIIRPS